MGTKQKTSVTFGWVVERNIGNERKVIVYLNDKRPWYQGDLHEARVHMHRKDAEGYAHWHLGVVREVCVKDGIITLRPQYWTGTLT